MILFLFDALFCAFATWVFLGILKLQFNEMKWRLLFLTSLRTPSWDFECSFSSAAAGGARKVLQSPRMIYGSLEIELGGFIIWDHVHYHLCSATLPRARAKQTSSYLKGQYLCYDIYFKHNRWLKRIQC